MSRGRASTLLGNRPPRTSPKYSGWYYNNFHSIDDIPSFLTNPIFYLQFALLFFLQLYQTYVELLCSHFAQFTQKKKITLHVLAKIDKFKAIIQYCQEGGPPHCWGTARPGLLAQNSPVGITTISILLMIYHPF
uniref:Uncharacterized protein n=1 Tax=Corethron hystrix TaxID=216773 RepID=A0A6U5EHX4_9STRA|mmetsp:Transcript_17648/g.39984  ORF Transcript_17648/g.39984 Transcript_17648/m.39984 type:complete len:134 (+) Transcript_17648:247-648(+)